MAVVRLDLDSDATWQRAWVIDTLAELATFALTYTDPLGPKRGDIVLCNEDNFFYLFVGNNNYKQVSGYATLPIQLNSDVTGVLPVPNGGLGLNTAVQGNIIYSDAADSYQRLAKDTNATRYLANTGTSNGPAWDQVELTNGVSGILPAVNLPPTFDWQAVPFNAGDFTASGSMTWTVIGANITINRFGISADERTGIWNIGTVGGTIGGTPDVYLRCLFPFGYVPNSYFLGALGYSADSGGVQVAFGWATAGGQTYIEFGKLDGSNWAAGTVELDFTIVYEVQP